MSTLTPNLGLVKPALTDITSRVDYFNANWDIIEAKLGQANAFNKDAWTSYAVAWTATTANPSIGNGTLIGRYIKVGSLAVVKVFMRAGSTTTFGTGSWEFSLPLAQTGILGSAGVVNMLNNISSFIYLGTSVIFSGPLVYTSTASGTRVNATTPFTWANGDRLLIKQIYEVTP